MWTVHMFGGPRRVNHAAVAIGTSIFTFGGYCSGVDYNTFQPIDTHVLDTEKLKWWKLDLKSQDHSSVPFQRYGHTAVAQGSKIYLWGGRNDREVCNTLYCYDTETQNWSSPKVYGIKPVPRDGHSACIINNCMYIFGGFQDYPTQFSQHLYMLNLNSMIWNVIEARGTPPSPRDFHTASAIGNKMYIFGGRGDENAPRLTDREVYCAEIHYFDVTNKTWVQPTVTGFRPPGRRSHSAFVHNGLLHIFGGFNKNLNVHFQDLYQYDPFSFTWKLLEPLGIAPCARRRHICQIIKDRVYISGGTSPQPARALAPRRLMSEYSLAEQILNELKDHDDLHVLNLKPSLRDMCLVNSMQFLKDNKLGIKDLCIPSTLKNDLFAVNPLEPNVIKYGLSYDEEFPPLVHTTQI